MTHPSDEALMAEFRQGGGAAPITSLIERHQQWAYNLAVGILRNPLSAGDATQVAFMNVIRHRAKFREGSPFKPWFARIVINACQEELRSSRRRGDREQAALRVKEDRHLERTRETLRSSLEELDEALRLPVVLCYQQGFTQAEAAETLGIPPRTLSERLRQALEGLRERLSLAGMVVGLPEMPALLTSQPTLPVPQGLVDRLAEIPRKIAEIRPTAWKMASGPGALAAICLIGVTIVTGSVAIVAGLRTGDPVPPHHEQDTAAVDGREPDSDKIPPATTTAVASPTPDGAGARTAEAGLRGRVVGLDQSPVAGASLSLRTDVSWNDPAYKVHDAESDAEGRFEFPVLPPAQYVLKADYRLYRPIEQKVDLRGGPPDEIVLTMEKGTCTLTLAAMDDGGQPVPDTVLNVQTEDGSDISLQKLATDASGLVELREVAAGTYTVFASRPSVFATVPLSPGQNRRITLVVRGDSAIAGRVMSTTGEPGAGLQVGLTRIDDPADAPVYPRFQAMIDDAGNYRLDALPAGRYLLRVMEGGAAELARQDLQLSRGENRSLDLSIERPGVAGNFVLQGRVTDKEKGQPVARARILGLTFRGDVHTDSQGTFTIEFKRTGNVSLHVMADGFESSGVVNTEITTGANELSVKLERQRRDPALNVAQGRVVYKEDGAPVVNAKITVNSGGSGHSAYADEQGRFRLNLLKEPVKGAVFEVEVKGVMHHWVFPCTPGDVLLEIDRRTASISGLVRGGAGRRVTLSIKGPLDSFSSMPREVDAEGRFSFSVPPGPCTLWVSASGASSCFLSRDLTLQPGEARTLELDLPCGQSGLRLRWVGGQPSTREKMYASVSLDQGQDTASFSVKDEVQGLSAGRWMLQWYLAGFLAGEQPLLLKEGETAEVELPVPSSAALDFDIADPGATRDLFQNSSVAIDRRADGKRLFEKKAGGPKYGFALAVPFGMYTLRISCEGCEDFVKELNIASESPVLEIVRLKNRQPGSGK